MYKPKITPKMKVNVVSKNINRIIYIAKHDINLIKQVCLVVDKKIKDIIKNES